MKRQKMVLNSFDLAFHELKQETGLLALHLHRSPSKQILTLADKLGRKHYIPLGKTSFILQYKKPLLAELVVQAIKNGDQKRATEILNALSQNISERARKGILNKDDGFLANYGFEDGKAYQIDIGSFYKNPDLDPQTAFEKSVKESLDPVRDWLAKIDPTMKI